jgi:hypothetical protein
MCHSYGSDFEELTTMEDRKGAAMAAVDDGWLAISSYNSLQDQLEFIDIKQGNLRPVYANNVAGEIIFIQKGIWNDFIGFWVYIKKSRKGFTDFKLTFWGKK